MDQQNILTNISSNKDLLWAFTERLCIADNKAGNNFQFFKGKKELFHSLSLLNKTFCDYYTNENIQQRIIDNFGNQRYLSTLTITQHLCFPKIGKKIIALHKKASTNDMKFTAEDLAESNSWYLNSTTDKNHMILSHYNCLLTSAIWAGEVQKASILIHNSSFSCGTLPLQCVIWARQKEDDDQKLTNLFNLFNLLLNHLSPDHRHRVEDDTALMLAAKANEKEIAQLLLERGANPFLLDCAFPDKKYAITDIYDHIKRIPNHSNLYNAFTLEQGEPKGWLMDMYKEIQKKKRKEETNLINNVY